MAVDLTLRNGLVVTPTGVLRGGLSITGERITAISPDKTLEPGRLDLDLDGKLVLPGVIDPHVHLGVGEGAGLDKFVRDLVSESQDAATGGVTTFITTTVHGPMPRTDAVDAAIVAGPGNAYVDYRLTASVITRDHVREIPDLVKRGVRSFKFYLGYHGAQAEGFGMSAEGAPWDMFYQACEAIAAHPGAFPMIHAEDPSVRDLVLPRVRAQGRADLLQAWHAANPDLLEPMQIYAAGLVAREAGCPLYVVHTSSAESVDLIHYLRGSGVRIMGETLVAYLRYTDEEVDQRELGAYAKNQPPIRSARDRERLWRGLNDGAITCIGTDALMYTKASRQVGFWESLVGLGPGMATTLPIVYTEGVLKERITLEAMARLLAENPARQFGLYPQKGVLQPGSDADLVVIDPDREMTIRAANLKSASGYSIYEGLTVRGIPTMTFVRGQLVARDYEIVAEQAPGRYVS